MPSLVSSSPLQRSAAAHRALVDARPVPFWLDDPSAPSVHDPLITHDRADLVVVGGGFSGLWSALLAKEQDPERDVVLLERESCPSGASGRNGGMMLGSLVEYNSLPYFKGQERQIVELAQDNIAEIAVALAEHDIDCDFEPRGWIMSATKSWQLDALEAIQRVNSLGGMQSIIWDAEQVQEELRSPQLLGGVFQPDALALVHPGKLAWGLKRACERLGVRFFEFSPALSLDETPSGVRITSAYGSVSSVQAILATYAHPSLVRRLRPWRIPIYSHVLATEPLSAEQMASIGWSGRHGFTDLDPFFYFYKLTADQRIIWGFVDATVHRGRAVSPEFEQDLPLFSRMAQDFVGRFPQLEGLRFTHRWGGAIDTVSRAAPFFGTTCHGRAAYCHGYMTGVGSTRTGALIMLDLLAGRESPYTKLPLVAGPGIHGRPSLRPYPPDPFLSLGMRLARGWLAQESETGKRHWGTKLLNRMGYIF